MLSYTRETVVAEKLEATVKLGIANSRMKDFYDLDVKERAAFHRFVQRSPIRNTLDSMVRKKLHRVVPEAGDQVLYSTRSLETDSS